MRYWTSDLHFGHARIQEFCPARPIGTVEQMNDEIVQRFNSVLKDDDELWVLGDVAMGPFMDSIQNVARIKGNKFLVPGNHDRCWSGMPEKQRNKHTQTYRDVGFTILPESVLTTVGGRGVCVSHFPYDGDHTEEDRYPAFRPVDNGYPLIHGHVHDLYTTRNSSRNSLMVNVGVDVWNYMPVSENTLVSLLDEVYA